MKLAILLARDPLTHQDAHTALHVAESALERGDEVEIFLLDGATILANEKGDSRIHQKLVSLVERGMRAVLCEHNATQRGFGDRVSRHVETMSVVENGRIAAESDRYLSFT